MSGTGDSSDTSDEKGSDTDREPDAVPQAGVLGNLPKTRPSVRSPRRKGPKPETASKPSTSEPAESEEPPNPPRDRSGADRAPDDREPPTQGGNDLDALARGGIAIAGEAASLGLRIAGRAAAALRDAVERR